MCVVPFFTNIKGYYFQIDGDFYFLGILPIHSLRNTNKQCT